MTRQDFIDDVQYWSELIDFCYEEGCYVCEDVYTSDQRDDRIDEGVSEMMRHNSWRTILDTLQTYDNQSGYEYYLLDGYGDWIGLDDDDFTSYKDDVVDWMDNNGRWDDEDDEDEDIPTGYTPEDITPIEAEDLSLNELFNAGVDVMQSCQQEEDKDIEYLLAM